MHESRGREGSSVPRPAMSCLNGRGGRRGGEDGTSPFTDPALLERAPGPRAFPGYLRRLMPAWIGGRPGLILSSSRAGRGS